jgi:hypothetical protein
MPGRSIIVDDRAAIDEGVKLSTASRGDALCWWGRDFWGRGVGTMRRLRNWMIVMLFLGGWWGIVLRSGLPAWLCGYLMFLGAVAWTPMLVFVIQYWEGRAVIVDEEEA